MSSESKVKAEMLNDLFSTVFTTEKTKRTLLYLNPLRDAKLVDIDVSVNIITLRAKLSDAVYICNRSVCGCGCMFVVVQKYTE